MKDMFKQKWFWITVLFATINIIGLVSIVDAIDGRGLGRFSSFFQNIAAKMSFVGHGAKKVSLEVGSVIKSALNVLEVKEIAPSVNGTDLQIEVKLNREPGNMNTKGFVEITPKVKFFVETRYWNELTIKGDFKPRQTYHVEVLGGLKTEDGAALNEPFSADVVMPDYEPTIRFKVPGMYLGLKGSRLVPFEAVNVGSKVEVTLQRLYDTNVVYFLNKKLDAEDSYWRRDSLLSDIGTETIKREIPVSVDINTPKDIVLDLKSMLPDEQQGLFQLRAHDPNDENVSDNKIVLITDIGILFKKAPREMLVWAASLKDAMPVADATVKVFSKKNLLIAEGRTDENGLMHFKDLDLTNDREPFAVTVTKGDDLSFLEVGSSVITETDFDVQGRPYLSAGYEGFIYSDRGVYRPGEKANVRTIVRAPGVRIPESFPVIFEIKRPDGKKFKEYNAVLNQFGTADVEVEFPDYALTGEYKIALKVPGGENAIGEAKINVEEFMPDSLKVTARIADQRFKKEDAIPVDVNVQQNYGAPAADRDVDVSFNLKTARFEPKDYKGFVFEDETREFSFKREYLDVKQSDENGNANVEIKLGDLKLPPSALEMSVRVTAKEIGGRGSSVYEERNIDVYPYYIGVKPQSEGNGALGQDMKFDYVALLPDGQKTPQAEISVDVCKMIWNSMIRKDANGKWQWVTESREDCFDHKPLTLQDAAGVFVFTPQDAGDYVLRFKGAGEKAHAASVKVFVEGPGVVSWAKERPDRIELAFDKPAYAVGETAQLTVKTPFAGKGLLTCASDSIFLSKTFDVSAEAQQEAIEITEDFSPNAYCALTVIRPVTAGEQWTSHRGYGVVPVVVNNEVHMTVIEVKAPAEVRPKDTARLDIQGPVGQPMEFSVALVDDAILRLTAFKTPDPYAFFYGKRMNALTTSDIYSLLMPELEEEKVGADSSPSGDGAAYDAKHHNPVNAKRVKSAVIWKSQIVTDADGKASVDFTVPDFNGRLRWVVVGAGETDFAAQAGDIKVVDPLVLNPFLPRFLAMNDDFLLPVSVSNMTKVAGSVGVSIEPSAGFTVTGEQSQSVALAPGKEGVVVFKLTAPIAPQKGEIKISASLGTEVVSSVTELAVRPPVSWSVLNGTVDVPAGETRTFTVPGIWLDGTARMKLMVSGMPVLKFSGGLGYLMKYPYGCIEQTVSSVFPLLYLRDLAGAIDSQKYAPGSIEKVVNAGIERAMSMQSISGSFGMWPGHRKVYAFGSVYATDFLVEADQAGYAVPHFAKVLALGYLEKVLSNKDDDYTPELKAYAAYVLAKAGRVNASWIRRLQEMKEKLPFESRFYVAAALGVLGDRKAVEDILGQGFPDEPVTRDNGGLLTSYARQNAVALSIYMDIDPQNAMIPVLVSRLEKSMTNGRWASTQENAQALIALGKYARYYSGEDVEFAGTVKVGDAIRAFNSHEVLQISDFDLSGQPVEVTVTGKGTAYVYWTSEGVPAEGLAKEEDKGLKVRREYLHRNGKPADLKSIKQGDTLIVDLSFGSAGIDNVVVEDLLPAGFEVENPRLKTTEKMDASPDDMLDPVNIDVRDDRMVLFLDAKAGTQHYRYIVRAVTKGDFVLPAVKAEAMYDPSVYSVSGQGRVQVVE
jgi:uncharacterized protein YfaS (alpha-2-macroglobulin family)